MKTVRAVREPPSYQKGEPMTELAYRVYFWLLRIVAVPRLPKEPPDDGSPPTPAKHGHHRTFNRLFNPRLFFPPAAILFPAHLAPVRVTILLGALILAVLLPLIGPP
jgi:hypothetical protein